MQLVLYYEYVPDILEKRGPYREAHLAHAQGMHSKGLLSKAGAFDPPEQGMYIFATEDVSLVEDYAKNDPYVAAGLVPSWSIRKWNVVVG